MIRRMYLNGKEKLEARRIIQEKTGYIFKSTSILNQIFRRSSFSSETGQNSNEIFEFIGDHVLSYYVVKVVSEKCGSLNIYSYVSYLWFRLNCPQVSTPYTYN